MANSSRRAPHRTWVNGMMAGILTHGSQRLPGLPKSFDSVTFRVRSPITVAGAVTELAKSIASLCSLSSRNLVFLKTPSAPVSWMNLTDQTSCCFLQV